MNSRLPRMRSRPLLALLALVSASGPDCKARPSPSCRGQPPMLLYLGWLLHSSPPAHPGDCTNYQHERLPGALTAFPTYLGVPNHHGRAESFRATRRTLSSNRSFIRASLARSVLHTMPAPRGGLRTWRWLSHMQGPVLPRPAKATKTETVPRGFSVLFGCSSLIWISRLESDRQSQGVRLLNWQSYLALTFGEASLKLPLGVARRAE